jgi:toxin YoeB
MRSVKFTPDCFKEYGNWYESNREIFKKINDLINDTIRNPFKGLGKPEPLKNNYKGYWSRRITAEHRLIYKVEPDLILFITCYGHY